MALTKEQLKILGSFAQNCCPHVDVDMDGVKLFANIGNWIHFFPNEYNDRTKAKGVWKGQITIQEKEGQNKMVLSQVDFCPECGKKLPDLRNASTSSSIRYGAIGYDFSLGNVTSGDNP